MKNRLKKSSALLFLAASFIMACALCSAEIRISELMYNPDGSDNNHEFVEIIGTANLSGYTIGDLSSNDSLELVKFVNGNFSLIVEEGFNHSNITCSVYSAGSAIGNNLNNGGDSVFLYKDGELVDFAGYDSSLANDNNHSLVLVNHSWQESCFLGGSPGLPNCRKVYSGPLGNGQQDNSSEPPVNQDNQSGQELPGNSSKTGMGNNTNVSGAPESQDESKQENNSCLQRPILLEPIIPCSAYISIFYDSLFKLSNNQHVQGQESALSTRVYYNISRIQENNSLRLLKHDWFNKTINYYSRTGTGSMLLDKPGSYRLCGAVVKPANSSCPVCTDFIAKNPMNAQCFIQLNFSTGKTVYNNREKISIRNHLDNKSFPFIIEYWIEDLFGNIVKKKINTSNTNSKSFTPDIDEQDRVFIIKNRLVFVACNNTNSDLENEKMIIIKNQQVHENNAGNEDGSSLEIEQVYAPEKGLAFGNSFKLRLDIHKGDTRKSVVKLYVKDKQSGEKLSEQLSFYLDRANSDYNLSFRLGLLPDCDKRKELGEHIVIAEGLGLAAEEEVIISSRNNKGCVQKGEKPAQAKISSFYTLSRKYSPEINLFANIKFSENQGGSQEHELRARLLSSHGIKEQSIEKPGRISFSANAGAGANLYILELTNKGKVIDSKSLVAELEGNSKTNQSAGKKVSEFSGSHEEQFMPGPENYSLENLLRNRPEQNKTFESFESMGRGMSGSVVYESQGSYLLAKAPYALLIVSLLVGAGILISKKK